jgi:hypothetical protein
LDSLSEGPRPFNLDLTLPDHIPGNALTFNGNALAQVARCNGILYCLLPSIFAIGPTFIRWHFGLQKDSIRFFWLALRPYAKIVFIEFHRTSFWSHNLSAYFSPCPVFNASKFLLSAAFDIGRVLITWKLRAWPA